MALLLADVLALATSLDRCLTSGFLTATLRKAAFQLHPPLAPRHFIFLASEVFPPPVMLRPTIVPDALRMNSSWALMPSK